MATPTSIVCKDCSHVNEAQRVYCHNCGVKLDRTAIMQDQQKRSESSEQRQRRVKRMMSPGGGLLGKNWGRTLFRTLFWAAVAGLAINIALPPSNVPPMPGEGLVDAPPLKAYLEGLKGGNAGNRLVAFKEQDVNLYLQSILRPKSKNKEGRTLVQFQRAFVKLEPGTARITSQTALLSHPMYMGITLAAEGKSGTINTRPVALHFGRLTVPEFIAQHLAKPADHLFASLQGALRQEQSDLNALGALEIREGEVILAAPGTDIPKAAR